MLHGDPAPPKRGTAAPHFLAHVYCGQTAGWIKVPLGVQVGLSPCHIVLDGDPALPWKGSQQPPNTIRGLRVHAAQSVSRVSNTRGKPGNLLEIYKVSWKFSGLVCEFAHLLLILVSILECISTKYLAVNQDQLIYEVSNLGNCQLTHLLIG